MAIGFRASSYGSRGAGTSPLSVSVPAGTASGDLMLMIADTSYPATATATGWTIAATSPVWQTTTRYTTVLWKLAGASEPAASVNTSASSALELLICGFTGVDATTPIDAAVTFGSEATGGTVGVPAITTLTANVWRITLGADTAGGFTSGSVPSGWTQRALPPAAVLAGHVCSTLLVAAAGSQSATSFTKGGGTAIAASLALRESGASVGAAFVPRITVVN